MKKNLSFLCTILLCAFVNVAFGQQGPSQIITGKLIGVTQKLSDINKTPTVPFDTKVSPKLDEKAQEFRQRVNKRVKFSVDNPNAKSVDLNIQSSANSPNAVSALITSFNGNGSVDNTAAGFGLLVPPDPVVSVGPNHVVQMINLVHKVFDKSGNLLTGPLKFSQIAAVSTDDGDPITLYDHIADRWVLLQFSKLFTNGQESLLFCVSQTNDPTGAYNIYEFITTGVFPDYPHVGIWNNAYVVTTHNFNTAGTAYLGQGFWAFDRNKMVAGTPTAVAIGFNDPTTGGYLPASMEGMKLPESSSMPSFITFDADEFGGASVDQLQVRTMTPNFVTPASSTLSAVTNLPTAAFDARNTNGNSVDQQGTGVGLDQLADRLMSRITYRRFDNYESMVMNYMVNVSGVNPTSAATYQVAPRWYELTRATPASPWVINQQSTYSPTAISGATGIDRWMSCPGIDQRGNIALGYSRSSTTNFPDIYYAERKKADALGTFGGEQVFHLSGGSQTDASGRWGDYSAMTTDPLDEETMWFTAEYYAATSARGFSTRIGSFKIADPITTITTHFQKSGTIARQIESTMPSVGPPNFPFKDYPIVVMIDNAPSQPANLTLVKTGTATEGTDYDILNAGALVLNAGTLTQTMTLRVYNDGLFNEPNETVELSYTLNANGGNAIAGPFNQKHNITIVGVPNCPSLVAVTITRPTTFCEGDSVILTGTIDPSYTYQWYKNGTAIGGATAAQYIAKTSGSYHVEFTRLGCTIPSTATSVLAKTGAPVPATVSRTIAQGTVITPGNGLQATAICPGESVQTYAGPTVGYDNNLISGVNPTVTFAGAGTNLGKVKISVTWRKKSGGNQTTCGDAGGNANPFNQEVSFKIKGPNNVVINLLNSGTYVSGGTPAGVVTTVFEDAAAAIGTVPASGTFNPAQSLSGFQGIDPNGIWTIQPNDQALGDPLCVQGFSVTILTVGTGAASSITWHTAATGGSQVGTGTEFIPTDTAPGSYTYYAQASCSGLTECATSIRKAARLTITPTVCSVTPPTAVSVNTTMACGGASVVLSATCSSPTMPFAPSLVPSQTGINSSNSPQVVGVVWYTQASGGVSIGSGSPFTTTPSATTTYYAACADGACESSRVATNEVVFNPTTVIPSGVAVSSNTICVGGSVTLSATCSSGTLEWYNALTGGALLGSGSPFTHSPTTTITYFAYCNVVCAGGRVASPQVTVTTPPNVIANFSVCSGESASLTASCASGILQWYGAATGGSVLSTVSPFVTPPLPTTTSYFAACKDPNASGGGAASEVFNFTGAMQTFTVPAGVTSINIETIGAGGGSGAVGGNGSTGGSGGRGSKATGTLAVTPGQVLNIFVGGAGATPTAGFNGGGTAGNLNSGGGGGASDVRFPGNTAADRIIVAGGGGGGGRAGCEAAIVTGGAGGNGDGNGTAGANAATPGGQAGGGAGAIGFNAGSAGIGCGGFLGLTGSPGLASGLGGAGGGGQACCCFGAPSIPGGGGGGGGYTGGGGGGGGSAGTTACSGNDKGAGGGGAGGTSFTGGVTAGVVSTNIQTGNGQITISYSGGSAMACESIRVPVTITVNPKPIVTANADQTICAGATTSLSATCNLMSVSATLSGASEVPANASTATGNAIGTFNMLTNQLDLTVSFNGLSANATAGHIHNAPVGVNGPVIIGFTVPSAISGTFTHSSILTATHAAALLAGNTYVNIHNTSFPGGEVRGQISAVCVANTYVWNPGALSGATVMVSPSTTTVYTVTASSASGCSATATTMVTVVPAPTASNTGPYLVGQTISLSASSGSAYSWAGPNSFTSTIANPTIASGQVINAGVYTVTVSNSGCTATATTNVIVNAGIDPCVQILSYTYVQSGNPSQALFPLTNGMNIAQRPTGTSVIVKPICNTLPVESVDMAITGPGVNLTSLQNVEPYALFDNFGTNIYGMVLAPGTYSLTVTGYAQDNRAGGTTYGPVVTTFTIIASPPTISMPTFAGTEFCAGATVNVSFTTTGVFAGGNMFNVLLSNASGSFDTPQIIGTTAVAGSVACTIPMMAIVGENYRIKVVSTDPAVAGNINGVALKVHPVVLNLVSTTNDYPVGSATKKAVQTINAKNNITGASIIQYKAGNAINLTPGFQVVSHPTSSFKADIGGCSN